MVNNFDASMRMLMSDPRDCENLSVNSIAKHVTLPEKVSPKTVQGMNKAAVKLCSNDLIGAKEALDELLEISDLKLVGADQTSASILPAHLINILIYFFLRTKNFKMARQLAKNRRFIVDTNYVEPPVSQFAPSKVRAPPQQ